MTTVLKQRHAPGEWVYAQGDPASFFYCIVSGEVEVVRTLGDGTQQVLGGRGPGEYFGELSMLEGRETHSVGMRAARHSNVPVEVLKLSRADFEAGFMFDDASASHASHQHEPEDEAARPVRSLGTPYDANDIPPPAASGFTEEDLRRRLLGFIRMVSRKQLTTLQHGETVFTAGDRADRFYYVSRGELAVDTGNEGPEGALKRSDSMRAVIKEGEGFGEWAIVRNANRAHTIFCASEQCEVVSIAARDFLQLVQKSEVVRRGFIELKESAAGTRPSVFVGDRPKPARTMRRASEAESGCTDS